MYMDVYHYYLYLYHIHHQYKYHLHNQILDHIHNSHKSTDDEYFMFVLSTNLSGNKVQKRHFIKNVMRAVNRKPHVFSSFVKNSTPVLLQNKEGKTDLLLVVNFPQSKVCKINNLINPFFLKSCYQFIQHRN